MMSSVSFFFLKNESEHHESDHLWRIVLIGLLTVQITVLNGTESLT